MGEVCDFHKEMEKRQDAVDVAVEGKIAKSSIKWIAAIFALPAVVAGLGLYAFVQSADYRYGTNQQALANAANIRLLDERTLTIKTDLLRVQADISSDLIAIKADLKDIAKEVRAIRK
jgi:hypothetical protein